LGLVGLIYSPVDDMYGIFFLAMWWISSSSWLLQRNASFQKLQAQQTTYIPSSVTVLVQQYI